MVDGSFVFIMLLMLIYETNNINKADSIIVAVERNKLFISGDDVFEL